MHSVLLLGGGNCKIRRIASEGKDQNFSDSIVTKVDIDPDCKPTVLMNLDGLGKRSLRYPLKKKLPFKDNTFDVVYSFYLIEHLEKPKKMFDEMYRILKPGGLMILWAPNIRNPTAMINKIIPIPLNKRAF